jgi:hypothetical protein
LLPGLLPGRIGFVTGVNKNVGIKGDHAARTGKAGVRARRTSSFRSPRGAASGPRSGLHGRCHRRLPRQ